MALTIAEMRDRKWALQALQRCKPILAKVQSLLCDRGHAYKPFTQGVKNILGEHVTVQLPGVVNCVPSRSCIKAGRWNAALRGSRNTGCYGRAERGR